MSLWDTTRLNNRLNQVGTTRTKHNWGSPLKIKNNSDMHWFIHIELRGQLLLLWVIDLKIENVIDMPSFCNFSTLFTSPISFFLFLLGLPGIFVLAGGSTFWLSVSSYIFTIEIGWIKYEHAFKYISSMHHLEISSDGILSQVILYCYIMCIWDPLLSPRICNCNIHLPSVQFNVPSNTSNYSSSF